MFKSLIYKIKKNPYKFFLLKFVVLFAIIFALDYSIGNTLGYFYFKQIMGVQYRTTYSIEKTKADILIFGSSRANHHYHPIVFEKRLNQSCYNAGRDGNFIFYHYAVLKGVLARYSPKIVILDFVRGEFIRYPDSYDKLSSLLPYYKTHPEMRSIIELKSTYEKIKLLSSIYPYNSSVVAIAVGNTKINMQKKSDINGYMPIKKVWDGLISIDSNYSKNELDHTKIDLYESFIQDCKNSKVKVFIICSPYPVKSNHADYSIILGKEIAKKYNVTFLDYSNDSIFINNPKLFADIGHLNDDGAHLFSNRLIDTISQIIKIRNSKSMLSVY